MVHTSPQSAALPREPARIKWQGRRKWPWIILILAAVVAGGLFSIRQYNLHRFHLEKQTRFMMDTFVSIYVVGPKSLAEPAINAAMDRMQEVDARFSARNPKSPVYEFNQKNVPITDPEILALVRLALEVAQETDGAFDITVAPLIELWGFYTDSPRLPSAEEIGECLKRIGYTQLSVTASKLDKKKADVQIDLGALAKGYAIAQAAHVLRENGIGSALIEAGGDIYALGGKGRDPWRVGIRKPRGDALLGYLEVTDLSVMGSGDYERFFIQDGKRYHHIFNPKTGYPAEGVGGTTLMHPDPAVADAWNTAVFVLGPRKGLEAVEKNPGMEAIWSTASGEILYSSGLRDALKDIQKITE